MGGECREAIFLKKGEVRSPHFFHFRDTDKKGHWRKGSDSSTQDQYFGQFLIANRRIRVSRLQDKFATNGKSRVSDYELKTVRTIARY